MNAEILKPYLQQAMAAFPGRVVHARLAIQSNEEPAGFQAIIIVDNDLVFWGATMEDAITNAKTQFHQKETARIEELRAKLAALESAQRPMIAETAGAAQ